GLTAGVSGVSPGGWAAALLASRGARAKSAAAMMRRRYIRKALLTGCQSLVWAGSGSGRVQPRGAALSQLRLTSPSPPVALATPLAIARGRYTGLLAPLGRPLAEARPLLRRAGRERLASHLAPALLLLDRQHCQDPLHGERPKKTAARAF